MKNLNMSLTARPTRESKIESEYIGHKSELHDVIPPEIKNDEFYYLIKKLSKNEQISTALEIGSSSGQGSTEAFVKGLSENIHGSPKLFCMEISKPRYTELKQRYADKSFVHCYNTSSVPLNKFPTSKQIEEFYYSTKTALNRYSLEQVLGWLKQDIDYVRSMNINEDGIERIKRENNINSFDMVLIDGSEFTGKSELDKIYGTSIILLDDINGFKNFDNYKRLIADKNYQLIAENWQIRNGYAAFKLIKRPFPIHFFTIVLNGEPFIRRHIEIFRQLPFKWHWHIVEGVAELKHDTGWSIQFGGKITDEIHRNGLSNDGTTEYLNELAKQFPNNITIYRNPEGNFWDGKLEMVNAPLANLHEECLLWQVDVDEYWTFEQICTSHKMFIDQPEKTATYYTCNFFVGPELVVTTRNTYGNHTDYEWLRTWHYKPGDRWTTHEPPCLCRQNNSGQWIDLAEINPFLHRESEEKKLVFNHYAYVTEKQLRFKELYYGYANAVKLWKTLQSVKTFPVYLKDYFPWVRDNALADRMNSQTNPFRNIRKILWIRADSIGDNILAASMLAHIKARYPEAKLFVLCQNHVTELYEASPFVDKVIGFNRLEAYQNESYRHFITQQLKALQADLTLNSIYSRDTLCDLFAIESGAEISIAFNGNLCNISADERDKNDVFYTKIIHDIEEHKSELERHQDFLEVLGISVPKLEPAIWLKSEDEEFAEKFFKDNNLDPRNTVCMFAGVQNDVRIYQSYGIALSSICKSNGFSVISLGNIADAKVNRQNLAAIDVRTIDISGMTTLRQTAAILKRCRVAVGAETGLAHMACAVGTPNIILLGGGHFGRFMPYSPLTSIACLPLECYNCNWQCKYDKVHCIKGVNPEIIAEAIQQTLENTSNQPRIFVQGTSLWKVLPEPEYPRWRSFHNSLNIADAEIIPVGDIPAFTTGIWQKLTSIDKTSQAKYLKETSEEFIRHGEKLFSHSDFDGAEQSFFCALELQQNSAEALNNLGVIYCKTEDNEKALQHYEAALKIQPNNITFLKNLGDYHYAIQKDSEKALQIYIKALSINPNDIEVLMTLGHISIENEQLESAKEFVKRIIEIDPENHDAVKIFELLNITNQKITSEARDIIIDESVTQSHEYLISAIVSVYNCERFIRGCLEDLEAQTIANRLEIIVIDSCSQQNEKPIIEEFQKRYHNIKYVRTDKRETVYAAWNRGIQTASGKYITNANTDDRHRCDAFEIMFNELESKPEIALVYADVVITEKENETFAKHTPCGYFKWLDWDRKMLLEKGCFMGPQPMWRRSVHDEYGYFDETMVTSGDYEFWLRISQTHNFFHIKTDLGLYLKSPASIEHRNRERQRKENQQIISSYRDAEQKGCLIKYADLKGIPNMIRSEFMKGIISIIIATHNHLDLTKKCIKSIRKHASEPYEIIFVDNASTDGTVKWLQNQVRENKNYELIKNKENIGPVKAHNQGIILSRGEYILLLDNDVVASDSWLSGMMSCLNRASTAGVVGAMSNNCKGLQQVTDKSYHSFNYLCNYAATFKEQFQYRRIPYRNIAGFCQLFKRSLVERIGLFDESFTIADFANDDFCLRASLAGYQNYIAGDVFVHHFGNRNFTGNVIDYRSTMSNNREIINKKWTLSLSSPEGKNLAVLKSLELADEFYQKGKVDQATKALINCITLKPDAKEIYFELTRMFIESKRFSEAWEVIESMPEAAKHEMKGLEYAGYAKEGLDLDDDAVLYANKMFSLNNNYPEAINLKGVLAYKKGEKEKAADCFRKAIEADPGYGEACTNLGVYYWGMNNKKEALAYLKKGFILSSIIPDVSSLYFSALTSPGISSEAEINFREACRLYPKNKKLAFLLIDILIKQCKFDSAMLHIEDALDTFGLDKGILNAALAVRKQISPLQIEAGSKKSTLSICMIVKNEERHLVRCLKSVRDIADEIIVVDTGSTDKTRDIASVFGAKVFDFPWTGDFAAARNYSLEQATCQWLLILDADEVISSRDFNELKEIICRKSSTPAAYYIATRNYIRNAAVIGWTQNSGEYPEEAGSGWVISIKVRLFTRNKDVFFSNPVHETLEDSLGKANIPIAPCKIVVHHYGKLDDQKDMQKGQDYYLLGKIKHENDPTNMKYILELARQAHELNKYEEAVELWLKLISILLKTNSGSPAYKELAQSTHGDPLSEIYIQLASGYLMLNRYEEALVSARKAMEGKVKIKEYIYTYAYCEIIAGSLGNAFFELDGLLKTIPDYPPALLLMSVIFCLEGKKVKAQEYFKLLQQKGIHLSPLLNKYARELRHQGRKDEALLILDAAVENKLNDEETAKLLEEVQK